MNMIEVIIHADTSDQLPDRITIDNDLTGNKIVGNYSVDFFQGDRLITRFRIENFPRGAWMGVLVSSALDLIAEALDDAPNATNGNDFVYGGPPPKHVSIIDAVKQMRVVLVVETRSC